LYSKYITKLFKYDKVLPMNTGAEGVETSMKLARKWGYKVKGIPKNKAIIICATSNFHGRTFGAISMSDDPDSYANYGPLLPGILRVRYGDLESLERTLKVYGRRTAAFICEPIQGEAGIKIPPKGYLKGVRRLCNKYNCLFIDDEVQSGCGRTGKMLAVDHENVRPDVVVLAKALGGGVLPVAAVLADNKVMQVIEPGTHGSTFGGNPLACAVGMASMEVLVKEKLIQNSARLGKILVTELEKMKADYPKLIKHVRGRGLFTAIEFDPKLMGGKVAYRYMYLLKNHGILAKTTHGNIIRVTPPLTLSRKQLHIGVKRMRKALAELVEEAKTWTPSSHSH
jgi:ornithine--oxo-acid transaminase